MSAWILISWSSKFYSAIHWLCIYVSSDFICIVIISGLRTYWHLWVITGLQFSTQSVFSETLKHMLNFDFSSGEHAVASIPIQHSILSTCLTLGISLSPTKAKIKHILKCFMNMYNCWNWFNEMNSVGH